MSPAAQVPPLHRVAFPLSHVHPGVRYGLYWKCTVPDNPAPFFTDYGGENLIQLPIPPESFHLNGVCRSDRYTLRPPKTLKLALSPYRCWRAPPPWSGSKLPPPCCCASSSRAPAPRASWTAGSSRSRRRWPRCCRANGTPASCRRWRLSPDKPRSLSSWQFCPAAVPTSRWCTRNASQGTWARGRWHDGHLIGNNSVKYSIRHGRFVEEIIVFTNVLSGHRRFLATS